MTDGSETFRGMPLKIVCRDVPSGKSAPDRQKSQYEAVVACSLTAPDGCWQFIFDPEMDVDNGN